jgi:hypothetical protein
MIDAEDKLVDDRDVKPNKGVRSLVSRQFPGHCHSMPSRRLHEIEFFSDLIISKAKAIAISQVKEITRRTLEEKLRQPDDRGQRGPPYSRSLVGSMIPDLPPGLVTSHRHGRVMTVTIFQPKLHGLPRGSRRITSAPLRPDQAGGRMKKPRTGRGSKSGRKHPMEH